MAGRQSCSKNQSGQKDGVEPRAILFAMFASAKQNGKTLLLFQIQEVQEICPKFLDGAGHTQLLDACNFKVKLSPMTMSEGQQPKSMWPTSGHVSCSHPERYRPKLARRVLDISFASVQFSTKKNRA